MSWMMCHRPRITYINLDLMVVLTVGDLRTVEMDGSRDFGEGFVVLHAKQVEHAWTMCFSVLCQISEFVFVLYLQVDDCSVFLHLLL